MFALVRDMFLEFGIDSDKAAKIDAARISARWNLRRQPIPRKWKNVREVLFVGYGRWCFIGTPIGTHLFLLIAKLRDGATVNMTDGCATMESQCAVRTNERHGRTLKISRHAATRSDATARFRGWTSRGKSRDWEGLTFDCESICLPTYMRDCISVLDREGMAEISEFSYFRMSVAIAI